MTTHKEKDDVSGVETTGHEWDGIKELNNPLPRWWLWIFIVTIIWAIGYWVIYPAWPTLFGTGERGGTEGVLGWSQYNKLEQELAKAEGTRQDYLDLFSDATFDEIQNDPELYTFALAGGEAAFKDNCATCHGTGGAGAKGYPNLNDDDWIWGGTLEDVYTTIKYGIRMHPEARDSLMPAFGEILSAAEISVVVPYVQSLSQKDQSFDTGILESGKQVFDANCASCHGEQGLGDRSIGAPNLADAIWLKSEDGSVSAITSQIKNPKHGYMPAWVDRLDDETIRQLTLYVHELGGGE
jgi:cytochrome c oxidase cbb3-type subunit 3